MYRTALIGLIKAALLLTLLTACNRQGYLAEQRLLEFGTVFEFSLIVDDFSTAERLFDGIEQRLRIYRGQWHAWEDSDLTRFNRALANPSGSAIPASLNQLLDWSKSYFKLSSGLFNPAMGKLIAAYGFHQNPANEPEIERLRKNIPDMDDLFVQDLQAHSRHTQLQLDFGGIAKGYAIALIARYLDSQNVTDYIINAGGDLQTSGSKFGQPWKIGIQNPYAPGAIASIQLKGRHSLFTSGNYQRQYRRGGVKRHHIIHPLTGAPSRGQSSATVLSDDPVRADVTATVLMVDGIAQHKNLARALKTPDYLIVEEGKTITVSRSLADKLTITVDWPLTLVD